MSKGANRKHGSFQLSLSRGQNFADISLTEALRLAKQFLETGEKEVKVVRE